ncbi:MAG TPA: DJ-1/PfpI family protein, partial [Candidatus Pelethenecus sp.]|nr:DJ-1/PfpI family protein [Candidatus Pelethenecus sp.]
MRVLALIFDGFEELEATAPFSLIRRAGIELSIASNRTDVIGVHFIHFMDIALINEVNYKEYDALLL